MRIEEVTLQRIDETHFTRIRRAKKRLKNSNSKEVLSSKLEKAIEKLKSILGEFGRKDLARYIESSIDVKAFSKMFAQDPVSPRLVVSEKTLAAFDTASPVISRQTLEFLVEGFLVHYDESMDRNTLVRLGAYIAGKLTDYKNEKRRSTLRILADRKDELFSLSGPKSIVTWSRDHSLDLVEGFENSGLNDYCDGRFFTVSRYLYYLEELREIPVGSDHKVLREVAEKTVYLAPGDKSPHLGHEILTILIDRSKVEGDLSDEWMRVILDIAGDPRVPEDSPGYRLWWSRLGADRIRLMRGWLSKLDLKLFLKALNDYGKSSGNTALQRMYPSRKRFLEGLIDQGLVSNSRLFINPRAEMFLKRGYKKEDLPEYACVKDSQRSMIYLQVGNLHMIEGSHSFKLWIFPKLPSTSKILNYQKTHFNPSDLSSYLESRYYSEFGRNATRPADITHTPANFSWQHKAIQYLKQRGVKVDVEKLFTKQDYAKYIRLKGL